VVALADLAVLRQMARIVLPYDLVIGDTVTGRGVDVSVYRIEIWVFGVAAAALVLDPLG
jgi:hypothetical protein